LSCTQDVELSLQAVGMALTGNAEATLLAHADMHAHNTFDAPDTVVPQTVSIDPTRPFVLPKAGILAISLEIQ